MVVIALAIVLLGCISLEAKCPTPPAARLGKGDCVAPESHTATPGPDQGDARRQRIMIPRLSTGAAKPAQVERIQEYLPGVEVRVYAGTGKAGSIDGPGSEAEFDGPFSLAIDAQGNLYVAELDSGRIRVIDPSGFVWTWVGGSGRDEQWPDGSGSPFLHPRGIAVGSQGQVYVVDERHGLTVIESGRLVSLSSGVVGFRDGAVAEAAFNLPGDVAIGPGGVVCISDTRNNRVRMLSATGLVGTLAGSGSYGRLDGRAMDAEFTQPNGLAFDSQGLLYIADGGSLGSSDQDASARVRVLSPAGQVSTYAGAKESGYVDGGLDRARFNVPLLGLAFDGRDNLFVADVSNHVVRVATRDGRVLTVAGTGEYGLQSGTGDQAMLGLPTDVVSDGQDVLYVADYGQNVIWQITLPDGGSNP